MKKNVILLLIERSLATLWSSDYRLILRGAKEESINHRLARYLEDELHNLDCNDLDVDLEYNSDGDGKKRIRIKNRYRNIRPDVILHERETNRRNFLAVEIKINSTSAHDRDKLIGLLKPPYNYQYGAAISCMPNKNFFRVLFFHSYSKYIWETEYFFEKDN